MWRYINTGKINQILIDLALGEVDNTLMILKFVSKNATCTISSTHIESTTKLRYIYTNIVEFPLSLTTLDVYESTVALNQPHILRILTAQTSSCEMIEVSAGTTHWIACSEVEVVPFRTSSQGQATAVYQPMSTRANQTFHVEIIIRNARVTRLVVRKWRTSLKIEVHIRKLQVVGTDVVKGRKSDSGNRSSERIVRRQDVVALWNGSVCAVPQNSV